MIDALHPDLLHAMARPAFYPHPVEAVERRETHISIVFLAGAWVYKIRKPVALEFLDFSDLEKRRHDCREEVRLNRRLTRNVYTGVVAITESGGRLALEGRGEAVEYAVKMRRLNDRHTMGHLIGTGALDLAALESLVQRLADFYRRVPASARIGGRETVQANCDENFRQIEPFVEPVICPARFDFIRAATHGFLDRRRALFQKRCADRRVREGHGDLRAEHIYFTPAGIQIIDCIEFNERMRYNDVASDIAFLAMDLDYRGAFQAAADVLNAFVRHTGDLRVFALIDFYRCYRACVRLKVTCFRLQQANFPQDQRRALLDRAGAFAALACRYARRFARPTIYVVMGMIATGKSTLARALGEALDEKVLATDRIRKDLWQHQSVPGAQTAFGKERYEPAARARVYAEMLLRAKEQLGKGRSIILDATFSRTQQRAEVRRLAGDAGAWIVFIECICPATVIRDRLAAREKEPSDSDARLAILDEFRDCYQPPQEVWSPMLIRADTSLAVEKAVADVFMASRQIYRPGVHRSR